MQPIELILTRLSNVKKAGGGWLACCPSHADRRASLSIAEGDDGRALLRCHAGCDTAAIVAALGLELRDLFPAKTGPTPTRNGKHGGKPKSFSTAGEAVAVLARQFGRRPDSTWEYRDDRGDLVGLVCRWNQPGGKEIRPVARYPDGWRIAAMPEPRLLYRLPELLAAGPEQPVLVLEGEKCCDNAMSLGFTAVTSSGGAQAANKTDWAPLRGRTVWVLPDCDPAGERYATDVAQLATAAGAAEVKIVHLPGLGGGGDLADWVALRPDASREQLRAEIEALAQAVEPWRSTEQPEPADDLAWRPFPIDALPEPARGFVIAAAKAIGCDPSYIALPLLVAAASAIGNTRRLVLKHGWHVPPILWGAIVGESGTAKTPAFRLIMRPVRERQRKALERHVEEMRQYEAELARWEKDYTAWKRSKDATEEPPAKPDAPHAERYIVSDTTVEALAPLLLANPRGLLLARDELAGWIGSFDRYASKSRVGADMAFWLSAHNAESAIVDRKTSGTVFIPSAAVCVVGGIQPAILQRSLSLEHRESGLAARLLLAYPPRKAKRWTEADIDPDAEAELARLFDRLYELQPTTDDDGEPRPGLVRLTPEAKAAWIAYYNAHAVEQADLTGDMAAAWSKLEECAGRLALVVHYVRWAAGGVADETQLDAASMNAGIELTRWFKGEAKRVFAMLDESDAERDQRRLVEWIGRKGGTVTAREAQQGCRWLKKPGAAEAALEELVKAGHGNWTTEPPPVTGGHSRRVFVLSTLSTSTLDREMQGNRSSVDSRRVDAGETATPASDGRSGLFGGYDLAGPDCKGGRLLPDIPPRLPD
jgi:hypothetical protein